MDSDPTPHADSSETGSSRLPTVDEVTSAAGTSELWPLTNRICDALDAEPVPAGMDATEVRDLCAALCDTVLAAPQPELFGDCAIRMVQCAAMLSHVGNRLAVEALDQAAVPGPDATLVEALRASDALELATVLRLAGWTGHFDLLAFLDAVPGPLPTSLARSVVRSVVACHEQWPEAAALSSTLRRVAGAEAPRPAATVTGDPADIEADACVALSRMSTLDGLRASGRDAVVAHLDEALNVLGPVLVEDDRVDAQICLAIASILRSLVSSGTIESGDSVDRLLASSREYEHFSSGSDHWVTNRVVATTAAWARLAAELREIAERFAEPSWLDAAAVIDSVVAVYSTSRSVAVYTRGDDDLALRAVIAPSLETGFAAQASLLHHLDCYAVDLRARVEIDPADPYAADLPVVEELLAGAADELAAREALPKPEAGDVDLSSTSPADIPNDAHGRIGQAIGLRRDAWLSTTGSLVGDELLQRVADGFAASEDYVDDVRVCVDQVTQLLVTYLFSCEQHGEAEAPHLYRFDTLEAELAAHLRRFLTASGQLGGVRTEVRDIGGGRVDIEFGFPGFNLYVELKVDSTKVPPADRRAYLAQTAAYQGADVRLGYLVVLRKLKPKAVPPHLSASVEVVDFTDDDGQQRHIAVISIAGNRTKPSQL